MTRGILEMAAANAAVIFVLALAMWLIAVRINDPSFIDTCWGAGFVVVAWVSFALADGDSPRRPVLVAITTVWGLRLAGYLFWRWRKNGPDARYVGMLKHAPNPKMYMLTKVFLLQSILLLVVSTPLQLGQVYESDSLSPLNIVGIVLAVIGIVFESTGDFQLVSFKSKPENKGKVMDRGLWRFTRHPNYFGDFCVWWGLFLVSLTNAVTVLGIIGPVIMSFLLMRYSGVGPLEKQMHRSKPQYKEYTARTSAFFPRPPRTSAKVSA
ncbi:MAG: DUF1295 domain-containing protein [Actinobacteria bacterium]|nr:DUF1295 domain-containing protein [Actinomycetota bacterium]